MSLPDPVSVPGGVSLDPPLHVAVIMDGNGRWASARGLPRREGHRQGVEALRRAVRAAGDLGIKVLTIYSFSAENWSRPLEEVNDLMGLLKRFVRKDLAELHENGVRVRVIGGRDGLDPEVRALLNEAEQLTQNNERTTLVVAFNYGGRAEILGRRYVGDLEGDDEEPGRGRRIVCGAGRKFTGVNGVTGESVVPKLPALQPVGLALAAVKQRAQQKQIALVSESDLRMLIQEGVKQ